MGASLDCVLLIGAALAGCVVACCGWFLIPFVARRKSLSAALGALDPTVSTGWRFVCLGAIFGGSLIGSIDQSVLRRVRLSGESAAWRCDLLHGMPAVSAELFVRCGTVRLVPVDRSNVSTNRAAIAGVISK